MIQRIFRSVFLTAPGIFLASVMLFMWVLYDSETNSDEMENHLEREEIKPALADGFGESSRYSATLTECLFYLLVTFKDPIENDVVFIYFLS